MHILWLDDNGSRSIDRRKNAEDASHQSDLRNSIRYPLHLDVTLKTLAAEYHVKTIDISAGGISFLTRAGIHVGSAVVFTIEMPKDALGTDRPVIVECWGRIVRCSEEAAGRIVAVVIDEYRLKRS